MAGPGTVQPAPALSPDQTLGNPRIFLGVGGRFASTGAEVAPAGSDPGQVTNPVMVRLASGFDAAGV